MAIDLKVQLSCYLILQSVKHLKYFRGIPVSIQKEVDNHLIEDKRNGKAQNADIHWNSKRHIPLVSLLLWRKMVAVHCFVWLLDLRLWSSRQKEDKIFKLKKNSISGSVISSYFYCYN